MRLEASVPLQQAMRQYRSQADILYAVPDYRRTLQDVVPNDPMFTGLWGLRNTGQAGARWRRHRCREGVGSLDRQQRCGRGHD